MNDIVLLHGAIGAAPQLKPLAELLQKYFLFCKIIFLIQVVPMGLERHSEIFRLGDSSSRWDSIQKNI